VGVSDMNTHRQDIQNLVIFLILQFREWEGRETQVHIRKHLSLTVSEVQSAVEPFTIATFFDNITI